MNVAGIQQGALTSLELQPVGGKTFEAELTTKTEASLVYSDVTDDIVLRVGARAWSIAGTDKRHQEELDSIADRNLPRLSWLVSRYPKQGDTTRVVINVHEFPLMMSWPEALEVGVDEKMVDSVRQKNPEVANVAQVTEWLSEMSVIEPGPGNSLTRLLISSGPEPRQGIRSAFRIHGRGYAIDIMRSADDRMLATRIVGARRNVSLNERRPVFLVNGTFRFVDATVAGQFRGVARTQLDQLVAGAGSYLGIWSEYNKLEQESILGRARSFGWLRYDRAKRLPDGTWRFQVSESADTESAFEYLETSESVDLEAAKTIPPELEGHSLEEREAEPTRNTFVGECTAHGVREKTVDILPPLDQESVPPDKGYVFVSLTGDRKRLARREIAQQRIAKAECEMPQLGLLLEGASVPIRRRKHWKPLTPAIRRAFRDDPTAKQIAAIDIALNTPDIALIQGPPGTGKTKIISALQNRLAEIADGTQGLCGQTLLTSYQHFAVEHAAGKTSVMGLPAMKIGRRRGQSGESAAFERWRRERVEEVRSELASLPQEPLLAIVRRVRRIASAYVTALRPDDNPVAILASVESEVRELVSPALRDRFVATRQNILREIDPGRRDTNGTSTLVLKAVRSLRSDAVAFLDDGPHMAGKVIRRLAGSGIATKEEMELLSRAEDWEQEEAPEFLPDLAALREQLLDRLTPDERPAGSPGVNAELESLLADTVDCLHQKARDSVTGKTGVLSEFLEDLEYDAPRLQDAVRKYTAVLAATCQQAASYRMSELKPDGVAFGNVLVDEAARANPLDLFIPMAMAEHRVILVGDHRQLPHILEPEIERQLEGSVADATRDALKKSLFQRLFEAMKAREEQDGIRRTVTLDVQYRMHPLLGDFVSRTFYDPYGEQFTSGLDAENFGHDLPGYEGAVAAWIDVPRRMGLEGGGWSKRRTPEARAVAKELKRLMEARPDLSFGVISFYSAQVTEILREMQRLGMAETLEDGSLQVASAWRQTNDEEGRLEERLLVGSVDAFQGKEFDVVFLSMTRCNDIEPSDQKRLRRKYGHLMLENRLCVALSRQRRLLVVAGDTGMLAHPQAPEHVRGLVSFHEMCGGKHGTII